MNHYLRFAITCNVFLILLFNSLDSVSAAKKKAKNKSFRKVTVEAVDFRRGLLKVTEEDKKKKKKKTWILQDKLKWQDIELTGTAEPSFLKKNHCVRFHVKLNKQGKAANPIKKLTLITPTKKTILGMLKDETADTESEDEKPTKEKGKTASKENTTTEENESSEAAPTSDADLTTYYVIGFIKKVKGEIYTINCRTKKSVEITLAEDVAIDVILNDPRYIRQGDTIKSLNCSYTKEGFGVITRKIHVKLTQPLKGVEKKSRRKKLKKKTKKK